jgi:hypothetical protein
LPAKFIRDLIDDLPLAETPVETIRSSFDRNHAQTLIGRITRGIPSNDNRISYFLCIARHACST